MTTNAATAAWLLTGMERKGQIKERTILWLVISLAAFLALVYLAPPLYAIHGASNYLPLHSALESAAIMVQLLIFAVVWNAYSGERSGNIVLLATGLLAAGLVDFAHLLSYKGMPEFVTPGGTEKAINFWLAARFITAVTLVAAALRPWRPFASPKTRYLLLASSLLLTTLIYWAGLFHEDAWPHTFIEGQGLTPLKVGAEYVLIALFGLAALILYLRVQHKAYTGAHLLAAAASISMLSELCFTLYGEVTDTFNLLGHIYKVIAFALIYYAVFVKSIREPYEQLHTEKIARAESEQRLQTIFDTARDGIAVADLETKRFLKSNQAFREMLGTDETELSRLKVTDIHPADQLDHVLDQFQKQAEGSLKVAEDIPVLRRDGKVFYADFSSSPLIMDGRPALLGLVRDTTQRRQMTLEITAGKERLDLALQAAHDGLYDWDIEQQQIYFSPRWKENLGYREEEIGNSFSEWESRLHPDDSTRVMETIQSLLDGPQDSMEQEFRLQHKDGRWLWFLGRGHMVSDRLGRPARLIGTHLDITEIKEAQLREEEARMDLRERLKEIHCLYKVTALGTDPDRTVDELLQRAVTYLPPAMLNPEQACASIRFDEEQYPSPGYVGNTLRLQAAITVNGEERGDVTICYRSPQPEADDGPFLAEERDLVAAVGMQLSGMIERIHGQERLQRINRILSILSESNRSLVRASTEQELAASMCTILVSEGNYSRAWIGLLDKDGTHLRQLAESQASTAEYPAMVELATDDEASAVTRALRDGSTQVLPGEKDRELPSTGCADSLGRSTSAIILPLKVNQQVIGVLLVCSSAHVSMESREVELFKELAGDLSYGIGTLRTRGERDDALTALEGMLFQTIDAIARTVEKRDPYTAGHQHRVAQLAEAIGHAMGLGESQITGIRLGATIHDIGKIYIPAELLNRPGKLTEPEFMLIKSHPEVGYEIVKDVHFTWPVAEMIRDHHERLDGSGYPSGKKGDEITLAARIIAVADVVEAVASHRPYRPALGIDKGLEIIREGRGTLFDPAVVDACLRLFEEENFKWL